MVGTDHGWADAGAFMGIYRTLPLRSCDFMFIDNEGSMVWLRGVSNYANLLVLRS